MENKKRKGLTRKQRELRKRKAKCLRDRIVYVITQWESELESQSDMQQVSKEETAAIREQILQEAYAGLVWRTLDRAERYNTPFHQRLLEQLKVEHPDLKVENKLHTFVSWPAFEKEDIEAALSANIRPLFDEERQR